MLKRIAVLSDIHGNLPALDAVLAELARERAVDVARRPVVQRALGEPAVEVDPVGLERGADAAIGIGIAAVGAGVNGGCSACRPG